MSARARTLAGIVGWVVGVLELHALHGGMDEESVRRLLETVRERAAAAGLELPPVLQREGRR